MLYYNIIIKLDIREKSDIVLSSISQRVSTADNFPLKRFFVAGRACN